MDTFRVQRSGDTTELYFPPLRMPHVALALGAFGIIGVTLTGLTLVALLPAALATTANALSSILLAVFIIPFMVFALMCVFIAVYMLANALHVRLESGAIHTARVLFGVVIKRATIERADITTIESEIASRYQSVFSTIPVYQLVARSTGGSRMLVAETLKGDGMMQQVRALIQKPIQPEMERS